MYTTETEKLGEAEGSWGQQGMLARLRLLCDCRVLQALEIEDDKGRDAGQSAGLLLVCIEPWAQFSAAHSQVYTCNSHTH